MEQAEIYIIEDNLIRRQLTLEHKLYQLHELVPGKRIDLGNNVHKVDVYQKIANKIKEYRQKHRDILREKENKQEQLST
ncbi:MAG: hypothetical protein MUO82_10485 [Candidatus Thermoplasmatota archaeon]|nr:hypothetical protein [Candidatus Thermoplasmatota archaeon]